ncbi:hypothetical protein [Aurantimonas coralicida]|uniref:hypothetical protein n=1 Tax=Aurantimonas coralicida TaxID=182270 RepID=UPI001D17F227|nr:hypothetical protein [Aurantimonas coralicida]MCC4296622.1 hypothetical protein [Aurantimonas coralicida]
MAESQKKQIKSKKTKTAAQAKPANEAEDFDFTGVPAEVKTDLLEIEDECVSAARNNLEEVFRLGQRFAKAKESLPKRYEEWVRKRCLNFTTRTASNYVAVHERFHTQKDKVIRLGLKSSALYEMANAPEAAVAEIFDLIESGETLLGADVTRVLKKYKDPAKQRGRPEKGGPAGLKAFVAECNVTAQKRWVQIAEELLAFLNEVYPDDNERLLVKKPDLIAGLVARAKWLSKELSRMSGCGFYDAADQKLGYTFMEIREWPSPTWKRLGQTLFNSGRGEGVPLEPLKQEIRDELMPGLRWALGREAEGDTFFITEDVNTVGEAAPDTAGDEASTVVAIGEVADLEVDEVTGEEADFDQASDDAPPAAPKVSEPSVVSLTKPRKADGPTTSETAASAANDAKPRSAEAS